MTERRSGVLEIRTSPHMLSGSSVDTIMFNVVIALVPALGFAVWVFGWTALLTLAVAVGTCVGVEHLASRAAGARSSVGDWSAAITGLLYGLTLPPHLPLWMTAVGGCVAMVLGKLLFGGLGHNPFNPSLVGRAFLQAAFPVAMTQWIPPFVAGRFASLPRSTVAFPFAQPVYDAVTTATPLARFKFEHQSSATYDLALGLTSGSTGETCAVLILLGGAYLVLRNMMSWRTPVAILATVAAFSGVLHAIDAQRYAGPSFMLFSGGLMLGAVFMATDPVTSPITERGRVIYGVLIGVIVVVIRVWGGMPEGVMYAILLGNVAAPHLDRLVRPRVYGTSAPMEKAR
jgi:H+/Na+-translocating ferredoxin:NAD+ oxidoreductase subunit D